MRLALVPLPLTEANAFVEQHHRHHGPVVGARFSIGAAVGEQIVGVAIVGRPVARGLQDGFTAEVVRLCTDSTPHAASKLYAASWRAWKASGRTPTRHVHARHRTRYESHGGRLARCRPGQGT